MSYAAGQTGGDPGLSQPWYGIGFGDALKRWSQKIFVFNGRASRGEFWWVYLAVALINLIVGALITGPSLAAAVAAAQSGVVVSSGGAGFIGYLVSLALVIVTLGLIWRRFHDTNRSGAFILLGLIPLVGPIIVIVLLAMPSDPAGARFDS